MAPPGGEAAGALAQLGSADLRHPLRMESATPPRDTAWAMSEENVEIVRTVLGAWNRNEQERFLDRLDPEIVFDATRREVNPKTYVGMEGMRSMLADRDEVWGEFRTEAREFLDAGDRFAVIGDWVGKGRGSGIEVRQPTAHLFTVDAGHIVDGILAIRKPSPAKPQGCRSSCAESGRG